MRTGSTGGSLVLLKYTHMYRVARLTMRQYEFLPSTLVIVGPSPSSVLTRNSDPQSRSQYENVGQATLPGDAENQRILRGFPYHRQALVVVFAVVQMIPPLVPAVEIAPMTEIATESAS